MPDNMIVFRIIAGQRNHHPVLQTFRNTAYALLDNSRYNVSLLKIGMIGVED